MLTNIGKMVPRDDIILNSSERYRNVFLDNSKEQRIKDMRNRKSQIMQTPLYFSK